MLLPGICISARFDSWEVLYDTRYVYYAELYIQYIYTYAHKYIIFPERAVNFVASPEFGGGWAADSDTD